MKVISESENFTLYERNIKVFKPCVILGFENIEWGENIMVDHYVTIDARKQKVKIGNYVHIPIYSSITGGGGFKIGNFATLSHGVRVITSSDDFTEKGFGNPTVPLQYRNVKSLPVEIGNFCVIGAGTIILPGVTIKEGAVTGAGSVITKNLESWGVYIGNNKLLKQRNRKEVLENYDKFMKTL